MLTKMGLGGDSEFHFQVNSHLNQTQSPMEEAVSKLGVIYGQISGKGNEDVLGAVMATRNSQAPMGTTGLCASNPERLPKDDIQGGERG